MKILAVLAVFTLFASPTSFPLARAESPAIPGNRVASFYISEGFINEQLALHLKTDLVSELKLSLDPDQNKIFLRGIIRVPTEELRAINLDPKLGRFRFQVATRIAVTKSGYLSIDFPLNETFFYPADSRSPKEDRVIVPVQMLSIALASARGYLAALSGDFGGFDRRTKKLEALVSALDRAIAAEKNQDALDDLKTQRESLLIQISAIPIERKQLQNLAKEYASLFGFTGEKELNLNDELGAKKNSLVLKIKIAQLVPYLKGVDLGGVRLRRDKKDGAGQNYLAIDVNSELDVPVSPPGAQSPSDRPPMKTAPSLIVRLNQSLFESDAVADAEKKEMGSKIEDFKVELVDGGMHVSGKSKMLLLFSVPFETIVDFVSTGPDVFEVRVREIKVAGIDFDFMAKMILESVKKRLNQSLKGMCKFKYADEGGSAHALLVTVDPQALVPAFPDLHLMSVDVRAGEFLLKVGRP